VTRAAGAEAAASIRVMVVDDQPLARLGLASVLAGDDIAVVASVDDVTAARSDIDVDVAVVDLSRGGDELAATTTQLRARFPGVHVVVLTAAGDAGAVRAAVEAGAGACLLTSAGADDLTEAVRGVTRDRSTLSAALLPLLVHRTPDHGIATGLTARERDILAGVAAGRTNKGIAYQLGLSEGTVRIYVSTVLAKLGVANRTEATALAIREGLVAPPKP
jgi:NarL family two-component system response regulator LiaR